MHDRGRGVENARRVPQTTEARGEDRADQGQADLAAVGVAGQEEVDVVVAGPLELIGAMGKGDAKRPPLRGGRQCSRSAAGSQGISLPARIAGTPRISIRTWRPPK